MHFVDVLRIGVFGNQAVHDLHGFVGLTDLIVCAGHLVQHLVVALVVRIHLEDFPVGFDRLTRSGRNGFRPVAEKFVVNFCRTRQKIFTAGRPFLEFEFRFIRCHGRYRFAVGIG